MVKIFSFLVPLLVKAGFIFIVVGWVKGLFIELLLICLCAFVLSRAQKLLILSIPILIHVLQLVNSFSTGRYIETLTLLNLEAATSLGWDTLISLALIGLGYFLLWIPELILTNHKTQGTKKIIFYSIGILFLLVELVYPKLPIHRFVVVLTETIEIKSFLPSGKNGEIFLQKKIIGSNGEVVKDLRKYNKPNLILIFSEGLSRAVVGPDLMPNTYKLLKNGISFENYYNHTAATFRGTRGQLISGYQYLGGYYQDKKGVGQSSPEELSSQYGGKVESLSSILKNKGYTTYFVSPHEKAEQLRHLMLATGFEFGLSAEDYEKNKTLLTDREQYEHIWSTVNTLHAKAQPFFLSAYIVGTHHGMDSPDLRYSDGSNSYLNKFHNQDHWLGEFLNKLFSSDLARDTIIVFTTDHATYPAKEYNQTFSLNAKYFIDRIPLVIYGKQIPPMKIDAKNRNSLCLVPTLLDFMDFDEVDNHFLGSSLFADEFTEFDKLSIFNNEHYDTTTGRVLRINLEKTKPKIHKKLKVYYDFAG